MFYQYLLWFILGLSSGMVAAQENYFESSNGLLTLSAVAASSRSDDTTYQATLQLNGDYLYVNTLTANTNEQAISSVYETTRGLLSVPKLLANNAWYRLQLQLNSVQGAFSLYDAAAYPVIQRTLARDLSAQALAVWVGPNDSDTLIWVGTPNGLTALDLSGEPVQQLFTGESVNALDVRFRFLWDNGVVSLLAAASDSLAQIHLLMLTQASETAQVLTQIPLEETVNGLCLYRHAADNTHYLFTLTAEALNQWQLERRGTTLTPKLINRIALANAATRCLVDDEYGHLYLAGAQGVWRYQADPAQFAIAGSEQLLTDAAQALALHYTEYGTGYVLVALDTGQIQGIRRDDLAVLGRFPLLQMVNEQPAPLTEMSHLAVTGRRLTADFADGVLVAHNTAQDSIELLAWDAIASFMDWVSDFDVNPELFGLTGRHPALVRPTVETAAVNIAGDAADDPAIWIHPTDPNLSTIIGTQKQGGLFVYDLAGNIIQYLSIGRINNVDLRYQFPLGDERIALVTATNRTDNSIVFYRVNPQTRELSSVAARTVSAQLEQEVYGLCMYHRRATDEFYVFVNEFGGLVQQWHVFDNGQGLVDAELKRVFEVGSQTEGCVADDYLNHLYIGEEDVGIWRYSAEPSADASRILVDKPVAEGGYFTPDVEGLALYYINEQEGYLLASSQGNHAYNVYERGGNHRYLGQFRIVADETLGLDGVTETDGIEVLNQSLGSAFPFGVFVVQDNTNTMPLTFQNFKLVPWEAIAKALDLQIAAEFKPYQ